MNRPLSKKQKQTTQAIDPQKLVNSNDTEAICDIKYTITNAKVGIPSEQAIEDAKDWVDNGSRL